MEQNSNFTGANATAYLETGDIEIPGSTSATYYG